MTAATELSSSSQNGATPSNSGSSDKSYAALRSLVTHNLTSNVVSTLLRATSTVCTALHPYFLAELVTSLEDKDRAFRFLLLLVGSGMAHMTLWAACDFYVSKRVLPLTYEFKRAAFNSVWSNDYRSFVDRPSGKTASYVNDLRNHVEELWGAVHFNFLPLTASLPIYVLLLYRSSFSNAVVYLVFLVLAGIIMTLLARPVSARQKHLTDTTATNNGRVFDSYSNFVNVFSFRSQRKEVRRNNQEVDGLIDDSVRFNYALSTYWAVAAILARGGLWTSIMGYSWYLYDTGQISFTAFVVSITVAIDFTNQYWHVVYYLGVWFDKSAAYREAYNYLFPGRNIVDDHYKAVAKAKVANPTAVNSTAGDVATKMEAAKAVETAKGRLRDGIEIRGLSFAYPDDPDNLVLDDMSFSVAKGEKVGVVGRSGEGKSTLIKILLGFYEPTQGQILVDGEIADAERLNQIQSYVPQDTSLFQESIEYNIAYADDQSNSSLPPDENNNHPKVSSAANKANISTFVESLPDGYDTLVGERGIKLSLGQRQRIAIARAFLKEADLLILDEATSALDSETEALIQASLEQLWTDRAAIIIAHRLATLNNVDRIIVMEKGRIVEQGTKDELLDANGTFAGLWTMQRSGMV